MIDNEDIQQAIVARLKANATLTNMLASGAAEVREAQWQGRDFLYPCVRVELGPQTSLIKPSPCTWSRINFSVYAFSEQDSSLQADQVASAVADILDREKFAGSGFRFFFCYVVAANGAKRTSEKVWRAEIACQSDLYTI
jgi:hypothetical protein